MDHLDHLDHLAHLRADLDHLGTIHADQLSVPVASCPGWDLGRLVDHLGRVHRMVLACLAAPDTTYPGFPTRSGLDGPALLEWFAEGSGALVRSLEDGARDRLVPTFLGPRPVGWWVRRQAHEHAVHRWDVQDALGTATPLDPDLAADGIAELLELRSDRGWRPPDGVGGTLHLHGTDGAGEWFVELGPPLRWETGHHKGDAAVRASRSDLALVVWGRRPAGPVEVLGDAGVLDAFLTDDF